MDGSDVVALVVVAFVDPAADVVFKAVVIFVLESSSRIMEDDEDDDKTGLLLLFLDVLVFCSLLLSPPLLLLLLLLWLRMLTKEGEPQMIDGRIEMAVGRCRLRLVMEVVAVEVKGSILTPVIVAIVRFL